MVVVFERIGRLLFIVIRSGELIPISYRAFDPADKSVARGIGYDRFVVAHRYRARGRHFFVRGRGSRNGRRSVGYRGDFAGYGIYVRNGRVAARPYHRFDRGVGRLYGGGQRRFSSCIQRKFGFVEGNLRHFDRRLVLAAVLLGSLLNDRYGKGVVARTDGNRRLAPFSRIVLVDLDAERNRPGPAAISLLVAVVEFQPDYVIAVVVGSPCNGFCLYGCQCRSLRLHFVHGRRPGGAGRERKAAARTLVIGIGVLRKLFLCGRSERLAFSAFVFAATGKNRR